MKNFSRNKLLLCFRPIVDVDLVLESNEAIVDRSKKQTLTLKSIPKKEDVKVMDDGCSKNWESSIIVHHPPKRKFSRLIKSILFETIWAKRVESPSKSSKHSVRIVREKSLDSEKRADADFQEIKTNSSSFDSSSLAHSTSAPESKAHLPKSLSDTKISNTLTKQKFQNNIKQSEDHLPNPKTELIGDSNFYSTIYLLVFSLAVTIFWGKLSAIVFTSIWLYFLPRRMACKVPRPENGRKLLETESRDYKKRVIMEGLLERNHRRGAINF